MDEPSNRDSHQPDIQTTESISQCDIIYQDLNPIFDMSGFSPNTVYPFCDCRLSYDDAWFMPDSVIYFQNIDRQSYQFVQDILSSSASNCVTSQDRGDRQDSLGNQPHVSNVSFTAANQVI